ncbi:MAG: hypothetical protein ACYDHX_16635 [Methanothrix sp.]
MEAAKPQGVLIAPPGLDHRPAIFVSQEDAIFAPFEASREIQTKTINTIF